jgi:hypothetical protein
MLTLPLRTLFAIANRDAEPPIDTLGISWHNGFESWDSIRAEWPGTAGDFDADELDEPIVVITKADVADEAAAILADQMVKRDGGDWEWDDNGGLLEDPERRGYFTFFRISDEVRGRGVRAELELFVKDGDEVVDSQVVWSSIAWEFESAVEVDRLQSIAWRLEAVRAEESQLTDERDELIRKLRPNSTLRAIANLAGISHQQVKNICGA